MPHDTSAPPQKLLSGYRRFLANDYPEKKSQYLELAEKGQKPETMVIACCDSRAAPETVFNASTGEMFVVRNVANLVQPFDSDAPYEATAAALEFASVHLQVKQIVVMGHARCGGIQASLSDDFDPLSGDNFVGNWIRSLQPLATRISHQESANPTSAQLVMERESIRASVQHLLTYSCVRDRYDRNQISLHGAWFDIASGELWWMDNEDGDFFPVT
ncbi:MAG: carbonic anhydrase [Pseudomonadota bacterium]